MKKPHVIAHMVSSIDGRSTGENWPSRERQSNVFESVAKKIKADAWLVGRTTMQEFSSKKKHRLGKPDRSIAKKDFVGVPHAKSYCIAIDPNGKCFWDKNQVTTDYVIEVLTEKVSTSYLQHLQDKKVSYIFAGKNKINLTLALKKLHSLFGIKILRVDGGGHTWGEFLKESLINEISHVLLPIADGSIATPTIFDAEVGKTSRKAKALRLKKVTKLAGGCIWTQYNVIN